MRTYKQEALLNLGQICSPFETIYEYVIKGEPINWQRVAPNFAARKLYDTQKNVKLMVGIDLSRQHNDQPILDGALRIDWRFFMAIPASTKKKKPHMVGKPHIVRPDISNLIKFYEDTCKGIIFRDDCLISHGSWQKVYDENPRTEFTITRL
jgi:Holliday junction resolvase RusA-like endonuclease